MGAGLYLEISRGNVIAIAKHRLPDVVRTTPMFSDIRIQKEQEVGTRR